MYDSNYIELNRQKCKNLTPRHFGKPYFNYISDTPLKLAGLIKKFPFSGIVEEQKQAGSNNLTDKIEE